MKIKTPHWFQRLNKWTDRQPLEGLLVIAVLCTTAMILCFYVETVSARQGMASFVSGLMLGMLLVSIFHVLDTRRKP